MDLIGYRIESQKDYSEKITAYFDEAGTEYITEISVAQESSPSFTGGRRQNKAFVDTLNWLENFNSPEARDDIFRDIGDALQESCTASITPVKTDSSTWRISFENPDPEDDSPTSKHTYNNDEFWALVELDCLLDEDSVQNSRLTMISEVGVGFFLEYNLLAADESREIRVHDGSIWQTVDISPGGHTTHAACSGADCRAITVADLTYSGANGTLFAAAYKQAIINGIFALTGAELNINYDLEVEYASAVLKVRLMNKKNTVNLLYFTSPGGGAVTQYGITRAAAQKASDFSGGTCFSRLRSLFESQITAWACEADIPCGPLSTSTNGSVTCSGSTTWGASEILVTAAIPAAVTSSCSSVKLTANADCANATYLWSTGETDQEIYVALDSGAYECDITCENGCLVTAHIFI